jgi:DNA-3-methyladenine glycosylase II
MWKDAEEFLSKDGYISPLIKKFGHCDLKPRNERYYFEDLVDAITQQQLSMKAASSIFNRIKDKIRDRKKEVNSIKHKWRIGATKNVEITPEKILTLTEEDLRECGLSRAKISYLKDLSQKVLSNKLKINRLDKLPDEEIMKELISVKGIGEWTAHMFLMFSLGRPDIFPSGDLGLRNAFEKVIKRGLDRKQIEKFALRWRPYRTIASWYIWKSLE